MSTRHTVVSSPVGNLTLVADDGALTGLYFEKHWHKPDPESFGVRVDGGFAEATRQLGEYFAGERTRFDLPLAPRGSAFQRRVWGLVERIPHGETTTYGALARELGDASLAREVGVAAGRNPLCLVVPCHRLVGAGGRLTGYAGGLARKAFLLDLEEPAEQRAARLF